MREITPFLWFDGNAEEAAQFYVTVFPDSRILSVSRYGEEGAGPAGSVMVVSFALKGEEFLAMNGGPEYTLSPAVSFMVNCETQGEIDYYWDALRIGGKEVACGWLTDKFGLSWQITPIALMEMLLDTDPVRRCRVMQAMMQMVKLDIAALQRAYDGL